MDRPSRFPVAVAPSFPDSRQMKVVRLPALSPGRLYAPPTPGNIPGTQYLLAYEPTPRPQSRRKDYSNEDFQWHHRGSNPLAPRLVCRNFFHYERPALNANNNRICIIPTATNNNNVKAQNIFHGRNNITCNTNCKNRTAATQYPRKMVCCRYIIVNTLHKGNNKYDDDDNNQ